MSDFRCCWCGREVDAGGDDVVCVDIIETHGPRLRLRWHAEPECFAADALNEELVSSLTAFDGTPHGGERVALAYEAIRRRVVAEYGNALQFIDVRRDLDHPRLTLRGSGEAWGVRSSRW